MIKSSTVYRFAVASTAYAVASYLCVVDKYDDIHCRFLFGKTQLAPIKLVSIPRLELMVSVLVGNIDLMLN